MYVQRAATACGCWVEVPISTAPLGVLLRVACPRHRDVGLDRLSPEAMVGRMVREAMDDRMLYGAGRDVTPVGIL